MCFLPLQYHIFGKAWLSSGICYMCLNANVLNGVGTYVCTDQVGPPAKIFLVTEFLLKWKWVALIHCALIHRWNCNKRKQRICGGTDNFIQLFVFLWLSAEQLVGWVGSCFVCCFLLWFTWCRNTRRGIRVYAHKHIWKGGPRGRVVNFNGLGRVTWRGSCPSHESDDILLNWLLFQSISFLHLSTRTHTRWGRTVEWATTPSFLPQRDIKLIIYLSSENQWVSSIIFLLQNETCVCMGLPICTYVHVYKKTVQSYPSNMKLSRRLPFLVWHHESFLFRAGRVIEFL